MLLFRYWVLFMLNYGVQLSEAFDSFNLFHDSNYFEGWQLSGDDGFDLISFPGGF